MSDSAHGCSATMRRSFLEVKHRRILHNLEYQEPSRQKDAVSPHAFSSFELAPATLLMDRCCYNNALDSAAELCLKGRKSTGRSGVIVDLFVRDFPRARSWVE